MECVNDENDNKDESDFLRIKCQNLNNSNANNESDKPISNVLSRFASWENENNNIF